VSEQAIAPTVYQSPEGHRWYPHPTRKDDRGNPQQLLSVTTALEAMAKGGLPQYYANLAAAAAMGQLPQLVAASITPPCTDAQCGQCSACVIKKVADTAKAESRRRTDEGRAVHRAVQQWLQADGMVIPEMDDTIRPYFNTFMLFMEQHGITPADVILSEAIVINDDHDYAGTLDLAIKVRASASWRAAELVARITGWPHGRITIIIDLKTRERDTAAFYPEMGLQVVGYYNAPVYLLPNGQEMPMPRLDGAAVLQVRPDGYAVQPAMCTEENFQGFLRHLEAFRWQISCGGKIVGVRSFPLPDEMQQTQAAKDRVRKARIADGRDPAPTRKPRTRKPVAGPEPVGAIIDQKPEPTVTIAPPAPRRRRRPRHLSVVPETAPPPTMATGTPQRPDPWAIDDDIPF
jgi:hypothetical protein